MPYSRRKKLLFLLSSLQFGGAEKQTLELINHIDPLRFQSFLIYLQGAGKLEQEVDDIKLSSIRCLNKRSRFDYRIISRLSSIISDIQPDVVICINPYTALCAYATKLLSKCNFRLIQVMHSTIARNLYEEIIVRFIFRWLTNLSDRVVFVCRNQMQYWVSRYRIKANLCCFIYNGVDTDKFVDTASPQEVHNMRQLLGIGDSDVAVCISAGLRAEKDHATLINACSILVNRGLPIKLLIVGDGVERNNIGNLIRSLRMTEHVILAGYQSDVRPYLLASDIVAITSCSVETFSMSILEAMALGKPIVASKIGGTPEQVIPGENGFLFPPRNSAALADCFEKIVMGNLFRQMGARSRFYVTEKFTLRQMVLRYEEILSAL